MADRPATPDATKAEIARLKADLKWVIVGTLLVLTLLCAAIVTLLKLW